MPDGKSTAMTVGGVDVAPGQTVTVNVPLARLAVGTELDLPVRVVRGKKPGPTVFVSAAIHGDELNGVEVIRRLLRTKELRRLRGTILVVPVVNVFGFVGGSRYLPDRRDLNRAFPGSERGSLASRVAGVFMREIASRSDCGIDLHTGALHRTNLPQVRCRFEDQRALALAQAFRPPVILDSGTREGSLRSATTDAGIPVIVYEGGEALRFDDYAIRTGLRGVLSVLRHLDMLPERKTREQRMKSVLAQSSSWVRAPVGGIFRPRTEIGKSVHADEVLGWIGDPLADETTDVVSPTDGVVVGALRMPLVSEGDALLHIARVERADHVANLIEQQAEILAPAEAPPAPPGPNPDGEEKGDG